MFNLAKQMETQTQISEDIFPSEAYQFLNKNKYNRDVIILDVCTAKEYAQLHLENAINYNFFSRDFKRQLNTLDKDKTYFVYCKLGGRSKMAQKIMKKLGFIEVYSIIGGTQLWAEENLPFAAGSKRPQKFTLCPISISITLLRKLKKFFQGRYQKLPTCCRQRTC